jgi:hypothetical protein
MPVHIRSTADGDLRLTLSNNGEVLHAQLAATPREANRVGIMMLASRDELHAGGTLTSRHADEAQSATVLRGPGGDR